jgi:hypothetical protein
VCCRFSFYHTLRLLPCILLVWAPPVTLQAIINQKVYCGRERCQRNRDFWLQSVCCTIRQQQGVGGSAHDCMLCARRRSLHERLTSWCRLSRQPAACCCCPTLKGPNKCC